MMRWLLVEAAQTAARLDPQLRRIYLRLKKQKTSGVAKVAVARRLAVRCSGCCARATIYARWFICPVARVARWFRHSGTETLIGRRASRTTAGGRTVNHSARRP